MRYDGGQGKCGSIGVKGVETRPPLPPSFPSIMHVSDSIRRRILSSFTHADAERVTATHHCCWFSWVFISALPPIGTFDTVTAAAVT